VADPLDFPRDSEQWHAIARLEGLGAAIGPRDVEWIHVELTPGFFANGEMLPGLTDDRIPAVVADINALGKVWTLALISAAFNLDRALAGRAG
jgi:hypothetical protein